MREALRASADDRAMRFERDGRDLWPKLPAVDDLHVAVDRPIMNPMTTAAASMAQLGRRRSLVAAALVAARWVGRSLMDRNQRTGPTRALALALVGRRRARP